MSAEPFLPGRRLARSTALVGLLGALALGAAGRFQSALALTLGTSVAIVSALWLAEVVERLSAVRQGSSAQFDRKFGFKAALRYAVVGLLLWGAVRLLPAQVPWLLAGLSTVLLALVAEEIGESRRGQRRSSS
jgi:hypothetical protein